MANRLILNPFSQLFSAKATLQLSAHWIFIRRGNDTKWQNAKKSVPEEEDERSEEKEWNRTWKFAPLFKLTRWVFTWHCVSFVEWLYAFMLSLCCELSSKWMSLMLLLLFTNLITGSTQLESFETLEDLKNVGKYEHIRSIYMQVVAGGQGGGTQNHYFQFGEMDIRIFIVTVCLRKFYCKHSSLPRRGNVRMKRVWKTHRILVCCQGSLMMLCYLEGSPHPNNLDSQFSLFFLWTFFLQFATKFQFSQQQNLNRWWVFGVKNWTLWTFHSNRSRKYWILWGLWRLIQINNSWKIWRIL